MSLQEIGNVIKTEESGQDFYKFCQEQSYPIEESFPHDQAVVNKVTKYAGYGNGISLSFERSHFGQDVVYSPANESITIYKVPPNLKDQLLALMESNANQSANSNQATAQNNENSSLEQTQHSESE